MQPLDFALAYIRKGYFRVDSDGSIWRLRTHRRGSKAHLTWLKLAEPRRAECKSGEYLAISLHLRGKEVKVPAHIIVHLLYVGVIPEDHIVNHKDGNKHNNHPDNLEAITIQANALHARDVLGVGPWRRTNITITYDDLVASNRHRVSVEITADDTAVATRVMAPQPETPQESLVPLEPPLSLDEAVLLSLQEKQEQVNVLLRDMPAA
jgi:hypothetical protein